MMQPQNRVFLATVIIHRLNVTSSLKRLLNILQETYENTGWQVAVYKKAEQKQYNVCILSFINTLLT